MAVLLETDTSANIDISTAVSVGAYTATATRLLHVRVTADQVAGGGDYVIYATIQRAGAGSHYRFISTTTGTAAAALASIAFVSIGVPVVSGDVVTVWLDGLAGDNVTPDVNVDWFESDYVTGIANDAITAAAIAAGAIDSATFAAGAIDAAAIAAGAIDAATFAAGAIDATAIANGAIDAATFAAGAIDAAAIATGAIDADALATDAADEIADHVWDEAIAGHLGAGSTGEAINSASAAGVWAYIPRTLTMTAAAIAAAVEGDVVNIHRGDTFTATFTGLADNSGHSKVWFTVKQYLSHADSAAIVQIEHTAGLTYLNGADASARSANGALTLPSSTSVAVTLDEVETDDLVPCAALSYDIQMLTTGGVVTTLTSGVCNIVGDVSRAVA